MSVHLTGILLGLLTLAAIGVSSCSGQEPEYGSDGLCKHSVRSPFVRELLGHVSNSTIQWTPDGSQILFDHSGVVLDNPLLFEYSGVILDDPLWTKRLGVPDIYAVHVGEITVRKVLDISSRRPAHTTWGDTTVFDLSPDGSRIAYTTCAVSDDSVQGDDGDMRVYNSEIFVSDFDGAHVDRLTNNTHLDTLPAWSPDGRSLAFISDPDRSLHLGGLFIDEDVGYGFRATTRITVHEVATGESREINLPVGNAAAPIRLEWSPRGDRIAFVVMEGEKYPWNLAVYIVGAGGTGLTRVSDAESGPTWSPDGEAIAMALPQGRDGWPLYIFAADGSNLVKERFLIDPARLNGSAGTRLKPGLWMGNLSWTPDGSRILLERFAGPDSVVEPGTAGIGTGMPGEFGLLISAVTPRTGAGSILASPLTDYPAGITYINSAAWSPDGTQIAVRTDSINSFELGLIDRRGNVGRLLAWVRESR